LALFGTIVRGVRINDDWIRVKNYYLPIQVGGRQVLTPAWWENLQDEEQKEKERQKRMNMASWIGEREEDDAKAEVIKKWRDLRGDLTAFDTSSLTPGSGTMYEVVTQAAVIRAEPEEKAKMENFKKKGDVVEFFEWDRTWKWRRCLDVHVLPTEEEKNKKKKPVRITGWMLVDHAEIGPLVRPQGFPTSDDWLDFPFTPIIAAVWENNIVLLQHLTEAHEDVKQSIRNDPTMLSVAVVCGHLDSVVILCEAGSKRPDNDLIESLSADPICSKRSDLRKLAVALVNAFSAKTVNFPDLDRAVEMLLPETQGIAERLLEGRPEPQPEPDDDDSEAEQEPELYEVLFSAVWVRAEPRDDAAKMTVRKQGEHVRLYDWDESGNWRRFRTGGVDAYSELRERVGEGWMMLSHPTLGNLLQRVDKVD